MKSESKKWSIQISLGLRDILREFCKKRGYKLSGFVEYAVLNQISGSYGK